MARRRNNGSTAGNGVREWVGGRLSAPMYVTEGEPYRPDVILWLELPDGFIVGHALVHPREPAASFAAALREAIERPAIGPPRQPERVRVADAVLAEAARGVLGTTAAIRIAPTPELDVIVENMADAADDAEGTEPDSYLQGGRVSPDAMADLFRAAHVLFAVAPWRGIDDALPVRVDIPRLDVAGACLAVIGALGESVGFLLFPSLEAYDTFAAVAERASRGDRFDAGTSWLSLTFERGADIPPAMRREVAEHGWPVHGADAYPGVVWRDPDGMLRPLGEREVRIMAACARSLAALCLKHGNRWSQEPIEPICESWSDADDLTVRFTIPYEAADLFAVNDPPAAPAARPRAARNAPCPCGSGKKYKKCCLDADVQSARGDAAAQEIDDERMVRAIFDWTARRFGTGWAGPLREVHDDATAQLLVPWCAYHAEVDGRRIGERYLEARGGHLPAAEREFLAAQLAAWLSIWEVAAVEPGVGLQVTDLLSGETRAVTERTASRTLTARATLLGRVVDHGGTSTFYGLASRPLPPLAADAVVQQVRRRLRRRGAVPVDRLRGEAIGRYMLARWDEAVADRDRRAATPPVLQNTDGHPLLFTTDHYDFDVAAGDEVARRLAALGAVEAGEPDAAERRFDVVRPGRAADEEGTIIAHLRLGAAALTVETNSVARADDLRRRLESAGEAVLRHRIREHEDPRALLERSAGAPRPAPSPPTLDPEDAARIEREFRQRHYQRWLDEPIPALGGETPRAAVRSAAGRQRVDVLLRDIEHGESRLPPEHRVDLAPLRRELALDR